MKSKNTSSSTIVIPTNDISTIPTFIFATANAHKAQEIEQILHGQFHIKTMREIGQFDDIEETEPTIEGNARLKARFLNQKFGVDCFSEDTGLEVFALDGAPGVLTARYAGEHGNAEKNMAFLLQNLFEKTDRRAQFRTVICLIINELEYIFEGICVGKIALQKSGAGGFGYDPIFIPDGFSETFAELDSAVKNRISHRGLATEKMRVFLMKNGGTSYV
jgi:XTP/dITP diphosphohydrolase